MAPPQRTVLITGANRGIGLAFCKAYAKRGWDVIATCRHPEDARDLQTLSTVRILPLDVCDERSIQALAASLSSKRLHLLINNAGIFGEKKDIDTESILSEFKVNALGPLLVSNALLLPLLSGATQDSPTKIVNITSRMGSIAENSSGGSYGYRASKAALNMITKTLDVDFKQAGKPIAVTAMHPGYIQTDMTNKQGDMPPEEAVAKMMAFIDRLDLTNSGKFIHRDGYELPW